SADPDVAGPSVSTHDPATSDPSMTRAVAVAPGGASAGATLVALDGDGNETERISITKAPVTIGRMSSNDVVLSDQNVSRKHAELRHEGGRWMIVDLGSTNGTSVNGTLAREHELDHGDRITFGSIELIFETRAD
ncbi:MAG: FHA domain-containing protein, partial [Actinobacteria bacterium]|nr:FHA domain-containing protein [Actinomycetota bacterium]